MIETRQLVYFVAAARCLNITRAASTLRVAQPALTRAIHHLEADLGVQLFRRVKNRISLTESGSAFLLEAESTLQLLDNSVLTAQRAARGEIGKLEIGFISTAGLAVMPDLIRRFRRQYPGPLIVLHEMRAAEIEAGLRNGRIDIGVSYGPMHERELLVRTLRPDRLMVAMPSFHALARTRNVDLSELRNEVFILPSYETAGTLVDTVLAECRRAGFQPRIGHPIATTTVMTTLGLISAGLGVTVTTENVRPFAQKQVVFRPIRNSNITLGLAVMCRLQDTSPAVQNFLRVTSSMQ
jgi:DNA-binding transcriptional LysR family regulator